MNVDLPPKGVHGLINRRAHSLVQIGGRDALPHLMLQPSHIPCRQVKAPSCQKRTFNSGPSKNDSSHRTYRSPEAPTHPQDSTLYCPQGGAGEPYIAYRTSTPFFLEDGK